MATIKTYKSYNFRDKNPIIDLLRTIKQDLKMSHGELAEATGISVGTIYNIFDGPTRDPRHSTIARMAIAFGKANMPVVPESRRLKAVK